MEKTKLEKLKQDFGDGLSAVIEVKQDFTLAVVGDADDLIGIYAVNPQILEVGAGTYVAVGWHSTNVDQEIFSDDGSHSFYLDEKEVKGLQQERLVSILWSREE